MNGLLLEYANFKKVISSKQDMTIRVVPEINLNPLASKEIFFEDDSFGRSRLNIKWETMSLFPEQHKLRSRYYSGQELYLKEPVIIGYGYQEYHNGIKPGWHNLGKLSNKKVYLYDLKTFAPSRMKELMNLPHKVNKLFMRHADSRHCIRLEKISAQHINYSWVKENYLRNGYDSPQEMISSFDRMNPDFPVTAHPLVFIYEFVYFNTENANQPLYSNIHSGCGHSVIRS